MKAALEPDQVRELLARYTYQPFQQKDFRTAELFAREYLKVLEESGEGTVLTETLKSLISEYTPIDPPFTFTLIERLVAAVAERFPKEQASEEIKGLAEAYFDRAKAVEKKKANYTGYEDDPWYAVVEWTYQVLRDHFGQEALAAEDQYRLTEAMRQREVPTPHPRRLGRPPIGTDRPARRVPEGDHRRRTEALDFLSGIALRPRLAATDRHSPMPSGSLQWRLRDPTTNPFHLARQGSRHAGEAVVRSPAFRSTISGARGRGGTSPGSRSRVVTGSRRRPIYKVRGKCCDRILTNPEKSGAIINFYVWIPRSASLRSGLPFSTFLCGRLG